MRFRVSPSRWIGFAFLAIVLATGGPRPAAAQEMISGPASQFVDQLAKVAIDTMARKDLAPAVREDGFRKLFVSAFDVPAIGRFTLGRYWHVATDDQKKQFLDLFQNMVVKTYAARFAQYSGQQFKIDGARDDGPDNAMVSSEIVQPDGGQPIHVDWRVLKPNGQLKIVDVVVEGVSMSVTEQQDFGSTIQRNGGDVASLISALKDKLAQNNG